MEVLKASSPSWQSLSLSLSLTHVYNWDNDGALTLLSSHRGERMVRRSQERIDSSGLAFKYIWWCKSYIWLSYKLSLYIFSLLLISKILLYAYCRHRQCHASSLGWKGKKKMVSAHLSGEKSDGRVNLRMCLSWGMHWIRKSSSHAFKSTRFGVNHVIFFYFLHCLSGHSILTSFAVSTQSRLHLSLSLSPLSLLDRFISYLFAWSLMSLTPLVSSLSPITVWFTYANLFLY